MDTQININISRFPILVSQNKLSLVKATVTLAFTTSCSRPEQYQSGMVRSGITVSPFCAVRFALEREREASGRLHYGPCRPSELPSCLNASPPQRRVAGWLLVFQPGLSWAAQSLSWLARCVSGRFGKGVEIPRGQQNPPLIFFFAQELLLQASKHHSKKLLLFVLLLLLLLRHYCMQLDRGRAGGVRREGRNKTIASKRDREECVLLRDV